MPRHDPPSGPAPGLIVPDAEARELRREALTLASWDLTARQLLDLELLLNGGFAPLAGYLGREDHARVLAEERLADGTLWPIPICLDVPEAFADDVGTGERIALREPEGRVVAMLTVLDRWRPDREEEIRSLLGTDDPAHPGVVILRERTHPCYLGGKVEGIEYPRHVDFPHLRLDPGAIADEAARRGWRSLLGVHTRRPLHQAEVAAIAEAAASVPDGGVLLNPVIGETEPGDVDPFTRMRCYAAARASLPDNTLLAILPLAMRLAGAREALWHAIVRRNHGCTHIAIGPDHAAPHHRVVAGFDDLGAAARHVRDHAGELGIQVVEMAERIVSGDVVRPRANGEARPPILDTTPHRIPDTASLPEVIHVLRERYPTPRDQGFTVFFTGLSGSGKSTLAARLAARLRERGHRPVTLLDGDLVRKHLSSELGFSREHRDLNVMRIGFVASEITRNGGAAVCAPIAPYRAVRRRVRELVSAGGGFIEVHVSTPLEVCEARDPKGLYAKARAGLIRGFTGIDDPYEVPERAELVVDTTDEEPEEGVRRVIDALVDRGYLDRSAFADPGASS